MAEFSIIIQKINYILIISIDNYLGLLHLKPIVVPAYCQPEDCSTTRAVSGKGRQP